MAGTEPLAAAFAEQVARLTGDDKGRLGLAVSGGPDSLALLLLAHRAMPGRIEAATVDHGLRAEAADEARQVAAICAGLGVAHAVLHPAAPITGSIQAAARRARYTALQAWRVERDLGWIATAHHADDQLETLLMRLLRGSGIAGLSGVRARNGHVIRPLLTVRRAELAEVVRASGIAPVDDPSNRDLRFDRVRVRQAIAALDIDAAAAARSCAALAEAEDALGWAAAREWEARADVADSAIKLTVADLPAELRRRLLVRAIATLDPEADARGSAMDHLLTALNKGEKASIGALLCSGNGDAWTLAPAPPRRTDN